MINQSINQSTFYSINLFINQSINRRTIHSIDLFMINQSINRLFTQSIYYSINKSINRLGIFVYVTAHKIFPHHPISPSFSAFSSHTGHNCPSRSSQDYFWHGSRAPAWPYRNTLLARCGPKRATEEKKNNHCHCQFSSLKSWITQILRSLPFCPESDWSPRSPWACTPTAPWTASPSCTTWTRSAASSRGSPPWPVWTGGSDSPRGRDCSTWRMPMSGTFVMRRPHVCEQKIFKKKFH